MLIDILKASYPAKASEAGNTKLRNMYIVPNKVNGTYAGYLAPTPGLKSWLTTITKTPIRGMHEKDGLLYVAAGDTIYKVDPAKTVTSLGTFNTETTIVHMTSNHNYLLMSDGQDAYTFSFNTSTYAQVTDSDFQSSTPTVTNVRDFFFTHNGKTFYWSQVNDPTSWDALDFNAAESVQETIVAVSRLQDFLFVFGNRRSEIWQVVGGSNPVRALTGILLQHGCAAKESLAEGQNDLFTLARGKQGNLVVLAVDRNFEERIISDEGLNTQLDGYTTIDDAIGFVYQKEGNEFYQITFPAEEKTWLYNVTTESWSELTSEVASLQTRHSAQFFAPFDGKNIVSDNTSSTLYELDYGTFTDGGTTINRFVRTSPILLEDKTEFILERLEIDVQDAEGLVTGQGSDPQLMLRKSGDGGFTWTNWIYRDAGKIGEYGKRVLFYNLGRSRNLVLEIQMSDPINWFILGAWAKVGKLGE